MYTIKTLADLANISTRTLRHYHAIGLLYPTEINDAGYRLYNDTCVDLLQQIMFYKTLGVSLNEIKELIYDDEFDHFKALKSHKRRLLEEVERMQVLIENVDSTIASIEGRQIMDQEEKFNGFKKAIIEENEKQYGSSARALYGQAVDDTNKKILEMDEVTFNTLEELGEATHQLFKSSVDDGPESEGAQRACKMHQDWIKGYWKTYSEEAHLGLTKMYTEQDEFRAFYDKYAIDLADFIYESMKVFLKTQ